MNNDLSPQEHQELIKANILGSFHNTEDILEKSGKKMPIGTTSNGYKKVGEGRWQKVSVHGMTKEEHEHKRATLFKQRIAYIDEHEGKDEEPGKIQSMFDEEHKHYRIQSDLDDKDYSDKQMLSKKDKRYLSKQDQKDSKEWLNNYVTDAFKDKIKAGKLDLSKSPFSLGKLCKETGMSKDLAQTIIFNLENEEKMGDLIQGNYDLDFNEHDMNDSYWDIVAENPEFGSYMDEEYDYED